MLRNYVIVDLETTGLRPADDRIIEVGAIRVMEGEEVQVYNRLVYPGRPIPPVITKIVGITDDMVADAPQEREVMEEFLEFAGDLPLLGHNLRFDYSFLKTAALRYGYSFERQGVDTLAIAKKYLPGLASRKLDDLCSYFGISDENHHRAWNDARVTGELYRILCERFEQLGDNEKDFVSLPLHYAVKKESPATARQLSFLHDLAIRYGIALQVSPDSLTKSQASRMIDKILSEYGR